MKPEDIEQMKADREAATDIPWDYVPGTKNHGPYVTTIFGSTVCDCYTISTPRYENESPRPVPFLGQYAEPNARRIARVPTLEAEVLRLRELLTEARTDLMICADNVRDAAKTDPRWEGIADKLMARVAECDKALNGAER